MRVVRLRAYCFIIFFVLLVLPLQLLADVIKTDHMILYAKPGSVSIGVAWKSRSLLLLKDKTEVLIYPKSQIIKYEIKRQQQDATYLISVEYFNREFRVTEVSSIEDRIKYKDRLCSSKINSLAGLQKYIREELPRASVDSDFDYQIDKSCEEAVSAKELKIFKGELEKFTNAESNPFLQCLSNSSKIESLKQKSGLTDQELLSLGLRALSPSESLNGLKIKCSIELEKGKLASYKSSVITLGLDRSETEKTSFRKEECSTLNSTIAHETLHHYGTFVSSHNQGKEISERSIKEEELKIKLFEEVCASELGRQEEDTLKCASKEDEYKKQLDAIRVKLLSTASLSMGSSELGKVDMAEVSQSLNSAAAQITPVATISESGWNAMAQSKPGNFPQQASGVIKSANVAFGSLSKIADQAIALMTNEAKASSAQKMGQSSMGSSGSLASGTAGTSGGLRSTVQKTKDSDFKTVEEYLVGEQKNQRAVSEVQPVSGASPSAAGAVSGTSNTRTKAQNPSSSAILQGGTAASDSRSSEVAPNSAMSASSSGANIPQNFKPQGQTRSASDRSGQQGRQPASAETGTQILKTQTEISGQDYRLIRRLYNDQAFKADLINQGIHIQTRAARLGVNPQRAKYIFEDTGTSLRKIGGQ